MPLVWWSRLAGFSQARRVCGSDLLDEVCAYGVSREYRHYFYGASPRVLELLVDRLQRRHPGLIVAGYRSPPFRPLTAAEDAADIAAINEAHPDFVWVGLGMPKQEKWMVEHLGKIDATALIGVGAAFDFHAGTKPRAPIWMQRSGLEWLFRLMTEPRRLAHRYLIDNTLFVGYMLQQVTGRKNVHAGLVKRRWARRGRKICTLPSHQLDRRCAVENMPSPRGRATASRSSGSSRRRGQSLGRVEISGFMGRAATAVDPLPTGSTALVRGPAGDFWKDQPRAALRPALGLRRRGSTPSPVSHRDVRVPPWVRFARACGRRAHGPWERGGTYIVTKEWDPYGPD